MTSTYTVIGPDGTKAQVSEDKFQAAIDRQLSQYNDEITPTTDEERRVIVDRMKTGNA